MGSGAGFLPSTDKPPAIHVTTQVQFLRSTRYILLGYKSFPAYQILPPFPCAGVAPSLLVKLVGLLLSSPEFDRTHLKHFKSRKLRLKFEDFSKHQPKPQPLERDDAHDSGALVQVQFPLCCWSDWGWLCHYGLGGDSLLGYCQRNCSRHSHFLLHYGSSHVLLVRQDIRAGQQQQQTVRRHQPVRRQAAVQLAGKQRAHKKDDRDVQRAWTEILPRGDVLSRGRWLSYGLSK